MRGRTAGALNYRDDPVGHAQLAQCVADYLDLLPTPTTPSDENLYHQERFASNVLHETWNKFHTHNWPVSR
jgi:hypothetical protein